MGPMSGEGVAAYQVPLTTPPAIPFQKELTSWIRRPGASLELSSERLAEAMDSGRVRISSWGRCEWLVGNLGEAESPDLDVADTCEWDIQTYLTTTSFQVQINQNKCGYSPGAWLEWMEYGSSGGPRGGAQGLGALSSERQKIFINQKKVYQYFINQLSYASVCWMAENYD